MTDRELLELAAKAAGYEYEWEWPRGAKAPTFFRIKQGQSMVAWRPLDDDGDALRLAVKLRMLVDADGEVYAVSTATPKGSGVMRHANHNGDPYAATRRAIVRAAAEIGKGMT